MKIQLEWAFYFFFLLSSQVNRPCQNWLPSFSSTTSQKSAINLERGECVFFLIYRLMTTWKSEEFFYFFLRTTESMWVEASWVHLSFHFLRPLKARCTFWDHAVIVLFVSLNLGGRDAATRNEAGDSEVAEAWRGGCLEILRWSASLCVHFRANLGLKSSIIQRPRSHDLTQSNSKRISRQSRRRDCWWGIGRAESLAPVALTPLLLMSKL